MDLAMITQDSPLEIGEIKTYAVGLANSSGKYCNIFSVSTGREEFPKN